MLTQLLITLGIIKVQ